MRSPLPLLSLVFALLSTPTMAQSFYYVGPSGGDFFDEANWNDMPDGTGVAPAGDVIPDDSGGAISLDLVIDNESVVAEGQVDFGPGSLTLINGADFQVTGANNMLDINSASSLTVNNSSLTVQDDLFMSGAVQFLGGSVTSVDDDLEFQAGLTSLLIDGATLSSGDKVFFASFPGSIANATFNVSDQFGMYNEVKVVMTDSDVIVGGGAGDVENVIANQTAVNTVLTLLGDSSILADTFEEGASLVLGGTSTATIGGTGVDYVDNDSTITLLNTEVTVDVGAVTTARPEFFINGLTGLDYLTDSSTWNVKDWNGSDAVTLQLVPEPTALILVLSVLSAIGLAGARS